MRAVLILHRSTRNITDMALTESSELAHDFRMPDFALPDVATNKTLSAQECPGSAGTAVIFLCRHCPYVVHVLPELLDVARHYLPRGIGFVGISANDADTYPDDAPEKLKEMVLGKKFPFPVLYDETQQTARAFHAVCTPEFFVFDGQRRLFYHGRMDGSTPGNGVPVTGVDLRAALDALLAGHRATAVQHPSMGCNIKWK